MIHHLCTIINASSVLPEYRFSVISPEKAWYAWVNRSSIYWFHHLWIHLTHIIPFMTFDCRIISKMNDVIIKVGYHLTLWCFINASCYYHYDFIIRTIHSQPTCEHTLFIKLEQLICLITHMNKSVLRDARHTKKCSHSIDYKSLFNTISLVLW